jgi:uncharacterized membrane protein
VALSFGVSIAIVPLIGFGLNYTPLGIRLVPILSSIIIFNVVFCALAMWRRISSEDPYQPFDPRELYASARSRFAAEAKVDKILTVVLRARHPLLGDRGGLVVSFPGRRELHRVLCPRPDGKARGTHITSRQRIRSVILGIANHEHRTVNYTVEVWLSNITYANNTTR